MCRDKAGKNLVHSLLDRRLEREKEVAGFKAMLDLIDKRLLGEMFVQRSGSLTPLASWLDSHHQFSGRHEDVLRTILACSGGKELSFVNGEGDTPLHAAVKYDDPRLVRILLEQEPTLLYRENATGRTPFEMAEDAMIAEMCNEPPPMPNDRWGFAPRRARRYGLPSHWHENLLQKDEAVFAGDWPASVTSSKHEVWDILQAVRSKLQEEGRGKRRLVTLNEANEVARRLAGMNTGGARSEAGSDVGAADEVQELMISRSIFVDV